MCRVCPRAVGRDARLARTRVAAPIHVAVMASPDGVVPGNIYLFRHGETEWSLTGQHTGTTDLPLLPEGEAAARELADVLRKQRFERVLVSPLQRAKRTAELAGLGDFEVEPLLREWDYGAYEGITTKQISAEIGRPWEVFVDGVRPGVTPGETVEQVVGACPAGHRQGVARPRARRRRALRPRPRAARAHRDLPRVSTRASARTSSSTPGSMSVLTHHRSTRCIGMFNLSPWRLLSED